MMEINEISPEKANEYIQSGALLIDVRELNEVSQVAFDVANIQHIPYSTFDENYMDIPKDRKLVFACHLGMRSLSTAQFLVVQGWNVENIVSLDGGIDAWNQSGFPVKVAKRTFSMAKPASACG